MRKIYFTFCMLMTMSLASFAQFNVTLQVDMNNETNVDTVSVAGSFQMAAGFPADWTPGDTRLTDGNSDGVYDITVVVPAGSYEYKFINGTAWGQDEGVPGACATNGNRGITISADTTFGVVCFASCAACPVNVDTVTVTLQVDMQNETVGDTVSVAGDIQGAIIGGGYSSWTPGETILTDGNSDGIYEITFDIPEGTYAFKYVNGTAWGQDEGVPSACAVNNNREITVAGPGPMVIPVHCYASCDTCIPPLPAINVTFRVDMSNEIVNSTGIYVAGSFQNPAWVKDTLQLTDPNSDGIYEYTESIIPAEYQFKYYNGDGGDTHGENADFETLGCGVSSGVGGWNRLLDITGQLTDTILPVWEFNTCNTISAATADAFEYDFNIYPNPFSNSTTIEIKRFDQKAYNLRIVNITGQVMLEQNSVRSDVIVISREGLPSGLYFVELKDSNGKTTTKKIIVQD